MKHKILFRISYIIIITACLLIIYIMYLMFCPYNIIDVKDSQSMKVSDKEITAGSTISHYMYYCKYKDYSAEVTYQIIDGVIFHLPTRISNTPVGCKKVWVPIKLPEILPPGEYYISAVAKYKVNPVREITKTFKTETFKIIE